MPDPDIQAALVDARKHHAAGRLREAEAIYLQVLDREPDQAVALHLLGLVGHQTGDNRRAVELISKALENDPAYAEAHSNLGKIYLEMARVDDAAASCTRALEVNPDFADAHNNLGNALKRQGRVDAAMDSYRKAIAAKPGFAEAHSNLGNALLEQGRRQEAADSFQAAVDADPQFAAAFNCLGNVCKELGRLDEAAASYARAARIDPQSGGYLSNLGTALKEAGRKDEAVHLLQTALQREPDSSQIALLLIEMLDHHIPPAGKRGPHAAAQAALQQETSAAMARGEIGQETVRELVAACRRVRAEYKIKDAVRPGQMFRGTNEDLGCERHKLMFETFNAIPENCFGCFKVQVEPRSLADLFKLMLVFHRLELPRDNIRKCMVERRPDISGTYKGLVYCRGLDEARQVQGIVADSIAGLLAEGTPCAVKRGCSEFALAHPDYGRIGGSEAEMMPYPEDWRPHEAQTDAELAPHAYPPAFESFSHDGLTLRDALVVQTWLEYAGKNGDPSYLDFSENPEKTKTRLVFRPAT